jgi:hypothetical protein
MIALSLAPHTNRTTFTTSSIPIPDVASRKGDRVRRFRAIVVEHGGERFGSECWEGDLDVHPVVDEVGTTAGGEDAWPPGLELDVVLLRVKSEDGSGGGEGCVAAERDFL